MMEIKKRQMKIKMNKILKFFKKDFFRDILELNL